MRQECQIYVIASGRCADYSRYKAKYLPMPATHCLVSIAPKAVAASGPVVSTAWASFLGRCGRPAKSEFPLVL
jgi:hypothetical protein